MTEILATVCLKLVHRAANLVVVIWLVGYLIPAAPDLLALANAARTGEWMVDVVMSWSSIILLFGTRLEERGLMNR